MKKRSLFLFSALAVMVFFLALPEAPIAQETQELNVETGVICKKIEERAPVDVDSTFTADVGQLCCFTKITGAENPTTIKHVWYFGDTERANVELSVGSISWRTHSSKVIMVHEVGAWRVEILDSEGTVLKTIRFEITG